MPFAVFRRHERKLMAVFAILAMFGFVVSDSLFGLLKGGREGGAKADTVVADLYGKPVRRSDLSELEAERRLANAFIGNLMRQSQFFGDTDTRSLVDAYILQQKANALGMPSDPDLAREWLRQVTGGQMDATMFETLLAPFRNNSQNPITGEQLLNALASQIRLVLVRNLPGMPEVTPLDVYQAYRDRYERVSARAVRFNVADYLAQVPEPAEADVQALYDRYKNAFPDPTRDTPGFKVPRLVQVESTSIDGETIADGIRAKLTEKELRDYYETRKAEFPLPTLPTLPESLFADDLQNASTPPPARPEDADDTVKPDTSARYRPFDEIRSLLEADLSREKAREIVEGKFEIVREAMHKYADAYAEVQQENQDARERGEALKALPARPDLKSLADKVGLKLELSPMLTREAAEHFGQISSAHVGTTRMSEGRKFADEIFSAGSTAFDPIDLVNDAGQYFLAWKIADNPPRVPPLTEVRKDVVQAWKMEKARPLARKAAQDLAEQARKVGGKLSPEVAGKLAVVTTDPVSKLESASLPVPGMFTPPRPRPTDIPQIPNAGDELRNALFELEDGGVAVEPDQPKTSYYVLTLEKRYPVSYETLYAPSGPRMQLQMEVQTEARERRFESWMAQLRNEAGLKPDWAPPDDEEPRRRSRAEL